MTKQLTEKDLRQQALRALTENSGQSKLDAFSPSFLAKPPITKNGVVNTFRSTTWMNC
ncbi:MAG: hypothetical protein ACTHMB_03490 [Candidatus Binatia bacterium]